MGNLYFVLGIHNTSRSTITKGANINKVPVFGIPRPTDQQISETLSFSYMNFVSF